MASRAAVEAELSGLTHFSFDVDADGVAVVLMDVQGDKVNTLSAKIKPDLERIVERLEADDAIRAVVFGSKKKDGFLAGADIESIQAIDTASKATELANEIQKAFARLEALHAQRGKPVVAAIHGPALGGGLELALACSQRVVSDSPKTVLGLPEVMLGVIPGAGGTQRLPRLIGVQKGLDLILTGRHVRPREAKRIGLADEIVPNAILLQVAKKKALEASEGVAPQPARGMARLRQLTNPTRLQAMALEDNRIGLRILFKKAREATLAKTRGKYPAPERALEVVRIGLQEGIEAGLAAEADRFGQLVVSPEAKALMSVFFAQQALKKENGVADATVQPRPVNRVGVLGGGLMGGGIAAVTAKSAALPVRLREIDAGGVARGLGYVRRVLDRDVHKRRLTAAEADRVMSRVTGTSKLQGLERVEIVIEAVFEDLELKQKVLREVEAVARPDVIFASNTSSLPITEIAAASEHPETVIGMHYFSPVEKMPLLEVITTKHTADWVTATCVALGKAQGKTVIVVRDGTGFYTSRILGPYMNEAAWLLAEEAAIEDLDEAMMDWGFPVGPMTLLDEVGIDVAAKVATIMEKAFGDRLLAPGNMQALIANDRKGRKNGKGFYTYENKKKAGVDESVYTVLGQTAKRRRFDHEEIQQRLGLQMVNEAARCLEEGILRSPRDGDIGAIFGLGFPPFTGGPFAYVDRVGVDEVVRRLERLADKHGPRFAPAQILRDYAQSASLFRPEIR